ncbi:MAG: glycoside hydrolase family 3 protein [Bacilli bacterium]|nr:glycoside hydrolase family 3 protein [Bacilli bacterium]
MPKMESLKNNPFYLKDEDIEWVNSTLNSLSLDEKIGQLFCLIAYSSDEGYLSYLAKGIKVGGIMCRVMDNEEIVKTVSYLQKNSKIPMLISANLEAGGNGVSLSGTKLGSELAIAATNNANYASMLGDICGVEGKASGVNWSFAPIVDIDLNFRNPITNTRTFGSDYKMVRNCGVNYIKSLQNHGLAGCAKHFPGDGVDERDQHLVTSINSLSVEEWDKTYGYIYKSCIDAGVKTIMVGHIMLPNYSKALNPDLKDEDILPATISKEIVSGLLKEKLGFNGLVITDSTTMAGLNIAMERSKLVPLTIAAGCDMFLFTKNLEEDVSYMKKGYIDGIITEERLNDAVTKVLSLKASLGLHKDRMIPTLEKINKVVGAKENKDKAHEVADDSITLVKNIQDVLPINPEKHKKVLFYAIESGEGQMGFSIDTSANSHFIAKLQERGFDVTRFTPKPGFEGMMASSKEIVENYDLIIYSANMATKSNQTVVRIEWAQPMGANVPIYIHSVPTIFISLENPYHLLDVPRVKTYINTYGSTDIILDALIDKLMGKSEFKGVSPVDAFCGKWDTKL